MSAELRDLRVRVTVETDCVLDAHHRVSGRDKSEIVREILHDWAAREIDQANVLQLRLRAEGIALAAQGIVGKPRESHP